MQTVCRSSAPRGWSGNVGGKKAGCGGPGLVWLRAACGHKADVLPNSLKSLWRQLMVEINIQFTGQSSACQLQAPSKVAASVVELHDKTAYFRGLLWWAA